MSLKKEMMDEIRDGQELRFENGNDRPSVEVWPEEHFADWISAHSDRTRNIICHTPEFRATPYCGVGCSNCQEFCPIAQRFFLAFGSGI
jgi:hypothetical protein